MNLQSCRPSPLPSARKHLSHGRLRSSNSAVASTTPAGVQGNSSNSSSSSLASEQQQQPCAPMPRIPASPAASRRTAMRLMCSAWPLTLASLIGSEDPTTIVNSVLGGYFLPRLPSSQGFKLLDEIENAYTLEYPRSWVSRPNSLRSGLYISDFNTSDKLTVEILRAPVDAQPDELVRLIVTSTIVPGFQQGQADDKLSLPPKRLIKELPSRNVDGQTYLYFEFPSETITRSGYQVTRRNFAVATIKRDNLFVCAASARTDQFNKDKEALLRHIVDSFQLR